MKFCSSRKVATISTEISTEIGFNPFKALNIWISSPITLPQLRIQNIPYTKPIRYINFVNT